MIKFIKKIEIKIFKLKNNKKNIIILNKNVINYS